MARPSDYSDALAESICLKIADGESLRAICESDDYPDRSTVFRWLSDPANVWFRDHYARAREASADADADDIGHYARQAAKGLIEPAAARTAIDGLKWSAGKRKPKVYGDSTAVKHSGVIGTFDASKHTDEELATLATVLGASAAGSGDAEGGEGGDSAAGG